MRHSPRSRRSTSPTVLANRAGAFLENLEPRQLMSSSFVYTDLLSSIKTPDAAIFATDYRGPIAAVGDIDGDGVTELLIGKAYIRTGTAPGQLPYSLSGAALFSGKTGAKLHTYTADGESHYGWSVAALGDVDADGTPDYAIGTAGLTRGGVATADVYSGKTNEVLFSYTLDAVADFTSSITIAAAGDIDDDGNADFFVHRLVDAEGEDADEYRLSLISGADGAVLRSFDDQSIIAVHGERDFNGDGIPDIVTSTIMAGGNHLTLYSGLDFATLFDIVLPETTRGVHIESGADFNTDGTPDLLVSLLDGDLGFVEQVRGYSGQNGAELFQLDTPDGGQGLHARATLVGDVNQDGMPDIAMLGAVNGDVGVTLYSGRDRTFLRHITDHGPATAWPGPDELGHIGRATISGPIAVADLNGDGFNEIIVGAFDRATAGSPPQFLIYGSDIDRTIVFDGLTLGNAVFAGTSVDVKNNLVGWGTIGQAGFIYFRGQSTYLKDLPGFSATDQIIKFTTHSGGYLIVAAPGGDQSRAFAWYGDFDLQNPNVYTFSGYGPPAEDYTFQHITDATNGQVMLQYAHAGDSTPAIFFFQLVVDRLGLVPRLSYAVDGVGIAVDSERYIYSPPDQPDTTVIVDFAGPQTLENFKPIDMRLLTAPKATPRLLILGLAMRDGDTFERPYLYDTFSQSYAALPLIEDGTDWNPLQLNGNNSVVGTYKTAAGKTAVFYTRYVLGTPVTTQIFDVTSGDVVGAPDGFADAIPHVLGLRDVAYTGPNEIFITHQGPSGVVTARLAEIEQRGPFGSTPTGSMAISEDGSVVVTTNLAGDLLVYLRNTHEWFDLGDWYTGDDTSPVYDTPHFGDIVTWTAWSLERPSIALSTDQGLILIESRRVIIHAELPPIVGERYTVRNLTTEIAGSEPITDSLLTFLPQDGRRIVGGLAADGDLVIYGMDRITYQGGFDSSIWSWAYGNLTDQVLRDFDLPVPTFQPDTDGDLVGYVTSWNGQNIAGVTDEGKVVVFWTSPAIQGWQFTSVGEGVPVLSETTFSHLSVYLTPWDGINLVGGADLNVFWWVPGQADWQFDRLTASYPEGPSLQAESLTSYVAPWGGLNVAGLDDQGQLWVYWWVPGRTNWTAEQITATSATPHIPTTLTGKLASAASVAGFDIYARDLSGDVMHYFWSVNNPWMVENISVAI